MSLYDSNSSAILTPEQVGQLVVEPVMRQSSALMVSAAVQTSSPTFRIPSVTADPSAEWAAEGAEIGLEDATLAEIEVTPAKLAKVSTISHELAVDSSPAALAVVGQSLTRSLTVGIDTAYWGTKGTSTVQPAGLQDLTGVNAIAVTGAIANLDPFAEAMTHAHGLGVEVGWFAADPDTALALLQLKIASGWNQPLLANATADGQRWQVGTIFGIPLLSIPYLPADTVYAMPNDADGSPRSFVVLRDSPEIATDTSAFFTSDRLALRATWRVGFAWPQAEAISKITHG